MQFSSGGRSSTTIRSMIRVAQDHDDPTSLVAMNRCIAAVWRRVFYILHARGYPLHRAEDVTQEFFPRFYQRGWIDRADPQRGRFRTFLLAILARLFADQSTERAPRQQVFDERPVTVSALFGESDRTFEPPDNRTPE